MTQICLVGYTYRGYPMAYAFDRAREFGYDALELRDFADVDLNSLGGVRHALAEAKELAAQRQLSIASAFLAPLPVSRDWGQPQEVFSQYLPILRDSGVPILHTRLARSHPDGSPVISAGAREADFAAAKETLLGMASLAAKYEVKIAIETHMGTLHDTAGAQLRIVQAAASPWVTASLDFANMLITYPSEDLLKAVQELREVVGYVHLKNVKLSPGNYDWNISLSSGDINYHRVLAELKLIGYQGPFAIEYCGTGDPDVFAQSDAEYLRKLLSRLQYSYKL